ncbi:hypothetical protein VNO78_20983 [Psophocarpus tetragonolobus]|uniref:Uncharacterized protein n=1 Tax=Psophocarpus tetragonolobus TaxID=3891 RepID=A0AAN9SCF1_PSOTE
MGKISYFTDKLLAFAFVHLDCTMCPPPPFVFCLLQQNQLLLKHSLSLSLCYIAFTLLFPRQPNPSSNPM